MTFGARIARRAVMAAIVVAGALVAGCGGGPAPLETSNGVSKGRALFYAQPNASGCVNLSIDFAVQDGSGFKSVKNGSINYGMLSATKFGSVDLDPGTYHILSFHCITSQHTSLVTTGKTKRDAAFLQPGTITGSLGQFTIGAGEVVQIGELTTLRATREPRFTDGVLIVADLGAERLADFKSANPALAQKVVARLAQSHATEAELAEAEDSIKNGNYVGPTGQMFQALQLRMIGVARAKIRAASG